MHSRTYVTVRYAETDRMGIAHHANFPIWFEIGRTDFIRLFDTTYTEMEESGIMTPVRNLSAHYILPAQYEDRLVIRTCRRRGSSSHTPSSGSTPTIPRPSSPTAALSTALWTRKPSVRATRKSACPSCMKK